MDDTDRYVEENGVTIDGDPGRKAVGADIYWKGPDSWVLVGGPSYMKHAGVPDNSNSDVHVFPSDIYA